VNNTSKAWSVVWRDPLPCYVSVGPSVETSWAVGQLQRTTSGGPANVELVAATIGTDLLR
jgi:hypothetical protein